MGFLSEIRDRQADGFDAADQYVASTIPEPGAFLDGHDVLTGRDHVAFHRLTQAVFDERGVYDMTFGYNLARLNHDRRHPEAGFRYARASDQVLRAEFTPTTEFCPQSDTLTVGAFRAWNGCTDRHEYDLVSVRVAPMHQRSEGINDRLQRLETEFEETGEIPDQAALGDGQEHSTDGPF